MEKAKLSGYVKEILKMRFLAPEKLFSCSALLNKFHEFNTWFSVGSLFLEPLLHLTLLEPLFEGTMRARWRRNIFSASVALLIRPIQRLAIVGMSIRNGSNFSPAQRPVRKQVRYRKEVTKRLGTSSALEPGVASPLWRRIAFAPFRRWPLAQQLWATFRPVVWELQVQPAAVNVKNVGLAFRTLRQTSLTQVLSTAKFVHPP